MREERRIRLFENTVLRRIFGPKRGKVIGSVEDYIMRSLMIRTPHQNHSGDQIENEMS
jgi:hypothetical protein